MSEWLDALAVWVSYRPRNFLMFAPRTYWRLFELHNQAWWPLHLAVLPAGVLGLAWLRSGRGGPTAWRVGAFVLALAWVFVAWAFVLERYAEINWAAKGLAIAHGLLALLLAALAASASGRQGGHRGAFWLMAAALLLWPALAMVAGRPWTGPEVALLAPDPTAAATLAWLLAAQPAGGSGASGALRRGAWLIGIASLLVSAATLVTMRSGSSLLPLAAAAAAWWLRRRAVTSCTRDGLTRQAP